MTGNGDNSVEFSVVHKRRRNRSEKNDDPHQCKTIVKIEPKYMQKIGIHEGDIVKISGITKIPLQYVCPCLIQIYRK